MIVLLLLPRYYLGEQIWRNYQAQQTRASQHHSSWAFALSKGRRLRYVAVTRGSSQHIPFRLGVFLESSPPSNCHPLFYLAKLLSVSKGHHFGGGGVGIGSLPALARKRLGCGSPTAVSFILSSTSFAFCTPLL